MIEVFYDCSSPWTYLGFESLCALKARLPLEVIWRPILVGAVFNAVNPTVYEQRSMRVPAKQNYMIKDLRDWAAYQQVEVNFPPTLFPINSAKAMRGCLHARGQGKIEDFSRAVFRAYWRDDRDIASDEVLCDLAEGVGLDGPALIAAAASQPLRDELRANTDDLIARGGFGSPTMFLDGDNMFFGNDRIPIIEHILRGRATPGRSST